MNIYEEKINKLNVEIKKLKLNQEKKAKNIKSLAPIVSALSAIRNCFTYYIFNNRIYRIFCNFARFGHGESYRSM